MAEAIFVALVAVYAVVAIKVDEWFTISRLGFKTETPQLFLTNSQLYHRARILLFAGAVISLFFALAIPWYVGVVGLFAVWLGAFWIGRKLAFNRYRQVCREMIEDGDNLKINDPAAYSEMYGQENSSIRRAELERGVRITDRELVKLVEHSIKWGI